MARIDWTDAVLEAIHRLTRVHRTYMFSRQELIQEELSRIVAETRSTGATPEQTLSRELQELRDRGVIEFMADAKGRYLLLEHPIDVAQEDLPFEAVQLAAQRNKLRFNTIPVGESVAQARQRKGQGYLRRLTLDQYDHRCALCEVTSDSLLVASHVARWADNLEGRGDLRNLVCMCRFDDVLFESGYISLADDYTILRKPGINQATLRTLLSRLTVFRRPSDFPPEPFYLRQHRARTGFEP